MCPNCRSLGREIEMSGPVRHPSGANDSLFFVCERCNHTMKERRTKPRVTPE